MQRSGYGITFLTAAITDRAGMLSVSNCNDGGNSRAQAPSATDWLGGGRRAAGLPRAPTASVSQRFRYCRVAPAADADADFDFSARICCWDSGDAFQDS